MRTILLNLFFLQHLLSLAQPTITLGPYLQSPTSGSIKVMWRSDVATISSVRYGLDKNNLNLQSTDTQQVSKHMLLLEGLQPFTKYYYAIYDGNTLLAGADDEHWFRTFPAAGTEVPTRIWAIGDFGKGNTEQARVRDAYMQYDTVETNLWLWLGDNAYPDGTEEEYVNKVFDSIYGYKKYMRHMPFIPTPGNHDYNSISPVTSPQPPLQHSGPYYDFVEVYRNGEAGGVPSGHELYYSFDYSNIHFINLNSELGSIFSSSDDWTGVNPLFPFNTSPMKQWLIQDLQANTKPWVIVYFHQPPYTDGSHESTAFYEVFMRAMRQNYTPILEQYGVDLVICGHTHVYERSVLVKGAYYGSTQNIGPQHFIQNNSGMDVLGEAYKKYTLGANPNQGTIYVNNGNSGSKEGSANFNHPYMFSEYGCDTCCGSLIIDIQGNRLDGKHLDMSGNIRDHFTLLKLDEEAPVSVQEAINRGGFSDLVVKPNPFIDETTVMFRVDGEKQVVIFLTDISGRRIQVQEKRLEAGEHSIRLNARKLQLSRGMYILHIKDNEGHFLRRMVHVK